MDAAFVLSQIVEDAGSEMARLVFQLKTDFWRHGSDLSCDIPQFLPGDWNRAAA